MMVSKAIFKNNFTKFNYFNYFKLLFFDFSDLSRLLFCYYYDSSRKKERNRMEY